MSCTCFFCGPILNQSLSQYWSVLQIALHFANTKLHRPLSLMRALWGLHENASMAEYSLHWKSKYFLVMKKSRSRLSDVRNFVT